MATELELTKLLLVSEIWRLYHQQWRVNDVYHVRINCIYLLEGFTSCVPSHMTTVDASLDVDKVLTEIIEDESEGDKVAWFDLCIQ